MSSVVVNRDVLIALLSNGGNLRGTAGRGVGKTTAAILRAIADSYSKPGEWVLVADPDVGKGHDHAYLVAETRKVIGALRLDKIEVAGEHRSLSNMPGLKFPVPDKGCGFAIPSLPSWIKESPCSHFTA